MSSTVVITQSNYLPWRGYFDLLRRADQVLLLDMVQYTRRDWRNRNLIKTPQGLKWLTIPVTNKGHYKARIDEMTVNDSDWVHRHQAMLTSNYQRAPYWKAVSNWFFPLLETVGQNQHLAQINRLLLEDICAHLEIRTPIFPCDSIIPRDDLLHMDPSERLIALCRTAGADCYLSGPTARSYIDCSAFERNGIDVEWMNYGPYPVYSQLCGKFEDRVSIIDMLFNAGPEAKELFEVIPEI